MSFSQENGYIPITIDTIMIQIMDEVNNQFGTSYIPETFLGTNFYKFYYALAQRLQESEIKTSEIFEKLKQYIILTNQRISRPVNTNNGIVEKLATEGYIASVKPMIDADAGKVHVCVDVDDADPDYDDIKLAICTLLSQITVAGVVSQGTETEAIVLSNGQSFDFKYNLPNLIPVKLKLTLTLSENNQSVISNPDDVKQLLLDNIAAKYKLGKNFEPQRYFTTADAPWTSQVLLEWSDDDGATWESTVYDADYDDLFEYGLADITLVEV